MNMEKVVQRHAEERATTEVDPKSKPKEKPYQAWTGAGNGQLASPLEKKISQVIETLCLNLHKYMKRPADGMILLTSPFCSIAWPQRGRRRMV